MAVKKNVQQSRKAFVQARLGQTGVEATPEQRAKLRERFNTLSQTKEGRTKIAKALLPGGTAAERKALKSSIRPTTGTTGSTTTPTGIGGNPITVTGIINNVDVPSNNSSSSAVVPTTLKTDSSGFVNKGYGAGIRTNNLALYGTDLPVPNTTTSTTVPNTTTTTVPNTTTSTTVPTTSTTVLKNTKTPIIVPGSSSGTRSDFSNPTLNFLFGGLPGTDSWRAKPLSSKELPLGTGNIYKGIQETKKGNYVGGIARTIAGVGELAVNILSTKGGGSYKPIKPGIVYPKTGLEVGRLPSYVGGEVALGGKYGHAQRTVARAQNRSLAKQLAAANKVKVPSSKIPAPEFGSVADQRAVAAAKTATGAKSTSRLSEIRAGLAANPKKK